MVIPFRTIGNELLRTSSDMVLYAPLWNQKLIGTTFYSMDSNRHLMTNTGATWGKYGRTFDGVNDVITLPVTSPLNLTSASDFTLLVWVKAALPTVGNVSPILTFGVAALKGIGLDIDLATNTGRFLERNAAGVTVLSTLASIANAWHFMAATNVGGTYAMELFLDGASQATNTGVLTLAPVNNEIGGNRVIGGSAEYLEGIIGEVLICNQAFSAGKVMQLYQSTKWRYS